MQARRMEPARARARLDAEADSALKKAPYHAFSSIVDKYAGHATQNLIGNGTHYRLLRPLNGAAGGMRIGSGNCA